MPALPAVPQVLKYVTSWKVDADTTAIQVNYWSYSGGPPSGANLATMAAAAVTDGSTAFQSLCQAAIGMESCEITDLTSSSAAQASGGTPWAGTRTGGALAPGTAVVVSHSISRRYRGGKPRNYLPLGVSTDITGAGIWSATPLAAFTAGWATYKAAILGSGTGCTITNQVNVSYYHGSTPETLPSGRVRNKPTLRAVPLVDIINSSHAEAIIGSQRRRNRKA